MEQIKKILNRLQSGHEHKSIGWGTSPLADWKIIFISASILAVMLIAVCVYMFIKVDEGEIFQVEKTSVTTDTALPADKLKNTVDYYDGKKAEFDNIRSAKESLADPSLGSGFASTSATSTQVSR